MPWRFPVPALPWPWLALGPMAPCSGRCWSAPEKETKRIEETEQRLQAMAATACQPGTQQIRLIPAGKTSSRVVKSLTFRMGMPNDPPAHLLGRNQQRLPAHGTKHLGLRLNPLP